MGVYDINPNRPPEEIQIAIQKAQAKFALASALAQSASSHFLQALEKFSGSFIAEEITSFATSTADALIEHYSAIPVGKRE